MSGSKIKQIIEDNSTVGYWDDFGGIEVHKIEETPEGIFFYIKAGVLSGRPTYHRRKVSEYGTVDGFHRDNVKVYNKRFYLDECLRV